MPERRPQRFAHTISLDHKNASVSIDGVELPYIVASGGEYTPQLVNFMDGRLWGVTLTLYADHVEVVGHNGERSSVHADWAHEADMEWARREARRIVLEGMADILEWCWNGTKGSPPTPAAEHVLALDEAERRALLSDTTHSDEGQENGDTA